MEASVAVTVENSSRTLGQIASQEFVMSYRVFGWLRGTALILSVIWASMFGYLEAVALNYSVLGKIIFSHFTIENVLLAGIALILGLLPFATAIKFGDSRLSKKAIISVFQIVAISVLLEDIAYFVALGQPIHAGDWTAQFLGGFAVPFTTIFVPLWYVLAFAFIAAAQYAISKI